MFRPMNLHHHFFLHLLDQEFTNSYSLLLKHIFSFVKTHFLIHKIDLMAYLEYLFKCLI